MFKKEMADKLKGIFGLAKVSYDAPGESFEQDTLFIEIANCKSNTGQGKATARVNGQIVVFSEMNKLAFGFFNKRIQNASPELTKNFFFSELDVDALNSPARQVNISERRASFVYLYSAQYDPNQGLITEIDI